MEQVLTLPGEVERWAHYGTEYVKADDYAALNDYAALVQMERDMARDEVEAHKRSRQLDANEARSREMEFRAEVERLRALIKRARPYVQAYAAITRTDEVSLDASETAKAMRLSGPT